MNITDSLPLTLTEEQFQTLAQKGNVKIERILSYGQTTPAGEWYDQTQDEWVMLVQGEAKLEYDDGSQIDLKKGDYVMIPAHSTQQTSGSMVN